MTKYRSILYGNYHSTQSGRASGTDARALFEREKQQFSLEILPLLQHLPKDAAILDIGCGSGSLIAALQSAGFEKCTGIDVSHEQVLLAHQLGVTAVEEGDVMEHLRNAPAAYQLICGMDIIEHFTKDELTELLQLLASSLKSGGMVVFRTPNLDAPMATVFANGDFTHENYLNASSATQVMLACGYQKVEVRSSLMRTSGFLKETIRRVAFALLSFRLKLQLFATARSSKGVLFTPNMIIIAQKP
jgi:2-polyprenyl-3-methyl-5-hydroxy-6-metoxy-1,4-benzoquinol methylase